MAIILEKSGERHRINLEKTVSSLSDEIIINLDWSKGNSSSPIDLDLGCFYELRDGSKMLIDGLQFSKGRGGNRHSATMQGCYDKKPFIWHRGDDRGAGASSGETILVNPKGVNEIRRIIVYTFIYEGIAKWTETNAVDKLTVPGNEDIIVKMGQQTSDKRFCAIAELNFGGDNSITVKKLVTFHDRHSDCDRQYGWGFAEYKVGTKD